MTRLPRFCLSKQNRMNKNRYKHFSQPDETVMRMRMYRFKLAKSLKSIFFKEIASTRSRANVHDLLDSCHVMT